MPATARSIRSNAAPAGRESEHRQQHTRPQLSVVKGHKNANGTVTENFERFISWTARRSTPLLHVAIAVVFLIAALVGSLALRTQMAQNSFEQTAIQTNISKLTQDVEDDQATLDDLETSLPSKAEGMGMVPQQGSTSIDLSNYHASEANK